MAPVRAHALRYTVTGSVACRHTIAAVAESTSAATASGASRCRRASRSRLSRTLTLCTPPSVGAACAFSKVCR